MSNLKIEGKIKLIYDTQTWDSGFSKREFVVTTQDQYPQDIKFEAIKDKCALLDNFNVGDHVDVCFNLRGNLYNEKYYNTLQAWRIDIVGVGSPAPQEAPAPMTEEVDDLPF